MTTEPEAWRVPLECVTLDLKDRFGKSGDHVQQPVVNEPISFNQTMEYFIDSLTGRSAQTRNAYYRDLLQFKLYLVFYQTHMLLRGSPDRLTLLQEELDRSGGRLVDTRYQKQHSQVEARPRAVLDEFDCNLALLTREVIVGYFGYLESMRQLSRNTLSRRLASLRSYMRLLSKEGYPIDPRVLEKLDDMDIRRERTLPIALEPDEARDFMSVINKPRDRAIVLVMLFMGLRISEVVRLNADDIEPHTEGITFIGKGAKERYVPVHPTVKDAVLAYKEERPQVDKDDLGQPLFVSQHGRRIDPSTVRKFIKEYGKKAAHLDSRKRRKLSPHKLRHTFATMLLQGDVDIRHIQELLGHEHLSTTEIYTSVVKRDLERAIARHPLQLDDE